MVAQRDNVVPDQRHRLVFNLPFVKIEVRRSLKHVARIDEQRVRIFFAHALYQSPAPRYAAFIRILLVIGRQRVDLRVGVVGMQNRDQRLAGSYFQKRSANRRPRRGRK